MTAIPSAARRPLFGPKPLLKPYNPPPLLSETIPAAFEQENLVNNVYRAFNNGIDDTKFALRRLGIGLDPEFNPYQEDIWDTQYEQFADRFAYANTADEIGLIKQQIDRELQNRDTLSRAGAAGFVWSMIAGMADPTAFASFGAISGIAKLGGIGGRLNRIRAGVKAFAAEGAIGAGIQEAALGLTQQTRTVHEVLLNTGGGALLAGMIGGAYGGLTRQQFGKLAEAVELDISNGYRVMRGAPSQVLKHAYDRHMIDAATYRIGLKHIQENPEIDGDTFLEIIDKARYATARESELAGVPYDPENPGRILGMARSQGHRRFDAMRQRRNLDENTRHIIALYRGADADTFLEEFMHRAFDRLEGEDLDAFLEYANAKRAEGDARPPTEIFAQEAVSYAWANRIDKRAGARVRDLFSNAKQRLKEIISAALGIRKAAIPPKILDLYERAGGKRPPAPEAAPAQTPSGPRPPEGLHIQNAGRADYEGVRVGRGGTSYTPQHNFPVQWEWEIVDGAELIVSNDPSTYEPRKNYPAKLQNRNRDSEGLRAQVESIEKGMIPERLETDAGTDGGAPIISPDYVVESGNGRTMAILRAYRNDAEHGSGSRYRKWLREWAGKNGVDPAKIDDMQMPMLVRRRTSKMDDTQLLAYVKASNIDDKARLTLTEQAQDDASKITKEMLADFEITAEGEYGNTFLGKFMEGLGVGQAAGYKLSDGGYSRAFRERVRAALFQRAYGDEALLREFAEADAEGIKRILTGMDKAAPAAIRSKLLAEKAGNPDAERFARLFTEAVNWYVGLRRNKNWVSAELEQTSFLRDPIPEDMGRVGLAIENHRRDSNGLKGFIEEVFKGINRRSEAMRGAGGDLIDAPDFDGAIKQAFKSHGGKFLPEQETFEGFQIANPDTPEWNEWASKASPYSRNPDGTLKIFFHGQMGKPFKRIDKTKFGGKNLYGPGFYQSDASSIGNEYSLGKRSIHEPEIRQPHVYPVYNNVSNPADMDKKWTLDEAKKIINLFIEYMESEGVQTIARYNSYANAVRIMLPPNAPFKPDWHHTRRGIEELSEWVFQRQAEWGEKKADIINRIEEYILHDDPDKLERFAKRRDPQVKHWEESKRFARINIETLLDILQIPFERLVSDEKFIEIIGEIDKSTPIRKLAVAGNGGQIIPPSSYEDLVYYQSEYLKALAAPDKKRPTGRDIWDEFRYLPVEYGRWIDMPRNELQNYIADSPFIEKLFFDEADKYVSELRALDDSVSRLNALHSFWPDPDNKRFERLWAHNDLLGKNIFHYLREHVQEFAPLIQDPVLTGDAYVIEAFRRAGYDGITHIGGGPPDHRVVIAWEEQQVKSVFNWHPITNQGLQITREAMERIDAGFARAVELGDKRLAMRMYIEAQAVEYRDSSIDRGGLHSPPGPDSGAPAWDLSYRGFYPEDVYGPNGLRYYGTGDDRMDAEAYRIIRRVEGKPNAKIRIYRAVEDDGTNRKILTGDWVTPVKGYAKKHGEAHIPGKFKIVSKSVAARDIWTNGDSWIEYGYHPQEFIWDMPWRTVEGARVPRIYPSELARRAGRFEGFQIAAPDTPEFREWKKDAEIYFGYHGTNVETDIQEFKPSREGMIFFTDSTEDAGNFAELYGGGSGSRERIYPAWIKFENPYKADANGELFDPDMMTGFIEAAKAGGHDGIIIENIQNFEYGNLSTTYGVFTSKQAKSAFNPRPTNDPRIGFQIWIRPQTEPGHAEATIGSPSADPRWVSTLNAWKNGVGMGDDGITYIVTSMDLDNDVYRETLQALPDRWRDTLSKLKRRFDDGDHPIGQSTTQSLYGEIQPGSLIFLDKPLLTDTSAISILGHEFGHTIQRKKFNNAPREIQSKVEQDYTRWRDWIEDNADTLKVKDIKKKSAPSAQDILHQEITETLAEIRSNDPRYYAYITGFNEWFADQIAVYFTTNAKPRGPIEKFYAEIADLIRRLYDWVGVGIEGRTPAASVTEFMDGLYESGRRNGPINELDDTGLGFQIAEPGTPGFKAWKEMGGIADDEGNLIPLYHATAWTTRMRALSPRRLQRGALYMAFDPDAAVKAAMLGPNRGREHVYPLYVAGGANIYGIHGERIANRRPPDLMPEATMKETIDAIIAEKSIPVGERPESGGKKARDRLDRWHELRVTNREIRDLVNDWFKSWYEVKDGWAVKRAKPAAYPRKEIGFTKEYMGGHHIEGISWQRYEMPERPPAGGRQWDAYRPTQEALKILGFHGALINDETRMLNPGIRPEDFWGPGDYTPRTVAVHDTRSGIVKAAIGNAGDYDPGHPGLGFQMKNLTPQQQMERESSLLLRTLDRVTRTAPPTENSIAWPEWLPQWAIRALSKPHPGLRPFANEILDTPKRVAEMLVRTPEWMAKNMRGVATAQNSETLRNRYINVMTQRHGEIFWRHYLAREKRTAGAPAEPPGHFANRREMIRHRLFSNAKMEEYKEQLAAALMEQEEDARDILGLPLKRREYDPEVKAAAKEIGALYNEIAKELKKAGLGGLPESELLQAGRTHFPRMWRHGAVRDNWQQLRRVFTAHQRGEDLPEALRAGEKEMEAFTPEEQRDAILASPTGFLLNRIEKTNPDDPLSKAIAVNLQSRAIEIPSSKLVNVQAFGKDGKPLVDPSGNPVLIDFIETDPELVFHKYIQGVAGDYALQKIFGDFTLSPQIEAIVAEAAEKYKTLQAMGADDQTLNTIFRERDESVKDLIALRDILRNDYPPAAARGNPEGAFARISSAILGLNSMNMLGGVMVSSVGDIVRPMFLFGLGPYAEGMMKAFGKMGTPEWGEFKREITHLYGVATELHMSARQQAIADWEQHGNASTWAEKGIQKLASYQGLMTGIDWWNGQMKAMAAYVMQHAVLDMADKAARIIDAKSAGVAGRPVPEIFQSLVDGGIRADWIQQLANSGISAADLYRIGKEWRAHGETIDGLRLARIEQWGNTELAQIYASAVSQEADNLIVTPGVGDKPLWTHYQIGKHVSQFKSYPLAAMRRIVLRGLQKPNAELAGGIMASFAMGAFTYTIKSLERGERPTNNPAQYVFEAIDRSGMTGYLLDLHNMIERGTGYGLPALFGAEETQRYAQRGTSDILLGPTASIIEDTTKLLFQTLPGAATLQMTPAELNAATRLIPYNRLPVIKSAMQYLKDVYREEFGE